MINTIKYIAITLLVAGCATNKLQPAIYSKSDIVDIESITIDFSQPISHLSIDHSSASKDPGLLMQTISIWAKNKASKEIEEVLPLFDTVDNRKHVENFIIDYLCDSLKSMCVESGGDASLLVTPIFVGFRFDQLSNLKYLPTYVFDIELQKNGIVLFKHIIGAGNLFHINGVQKTGVRPEFGYKNPIQIIENREEALSRMEEVMRELSQEIVIFFSDSSQRNI
jgi:hypothetical protein